MIKGATGFPFGSEAASVDAKPTSGLSPGPDIDSGPGMSLSCHERTHAQQVRRAQEAKRIAACSDIKARCTSEPGMAVEALFLRRNALRLCALRVLKGAG